MKTNTTMIHLGGLATMVRSHRMSIRKHGISSGMVAAIALTCASATGCAMTDEEVQDGQSALEDSAKTITPFSSANVITLHCGLVTLSMSSSDGASGGCGQGETTRTAFIAGSQLIITPIPDTIVCRDWNGWTGACAGRGRTCVLPNVNTDVSVGVIEGRLFGCTPQ
jgi:hypothetical protein